MHLKTLKTAALGLLMSAAVAMPAMAEDDDCQYNAGLINKVAQAMQLLQEVKENLTIPPMRSADPPCCERPGLLVRIAHADKVVKGQPALPDELKLVIGKAGQVQARMVVNTFIKGCTVQVLAVEQK